VEVPVRRVARVGDHLEVSAPPSPETTFRLVRTQEQRGAVTSFLLAQGWVGLHLGDSLRRLQDRGDELSLLALFGTSGEVRAVALSQPGRLNLLAPLAQDRPAAERLIAERLDSLERFSCLESQLPLELTNRFDVYVRDVTVAATVRVPARPLCPVRPAVAADAPDLYRIYDSVSWMRLDSPQHWAERLASERTFVAEVDGHLAAVARWTKSYGRVVEVGGVATDPVLRRRGGATAVVLAATAAALSEQMTPVLCFGEPALGALYHPLGFERVGRELAFRRRPPASMGI